MSGGGLSGWLAEDRDILRALRPGDWLVVAAVTVVCGVAGIVLLGPLVGGAALVFGGLAVTVAACDARVQLVPDVLSLALALAGLGFALALARPADLWPAMAASIAGAALGGLILFALRWLWFRSRGVEAIGLGDVKLAAAIGIWLGPFDIPYAILVAAITGIVLATIGEHLGRSVAADGRLPFAALLAPAAWLTFVLVRL